MAARKRKKNESFKKYRKNLVKEQMADDNRKVNIVWRSSILGTASSVLVNGKQKYMRYFRPEGLFPS